MRELEEPAYIPVGFLVTVVLLTLERKRRRRQDEVDRLRGDGLHDVKRITQKRLTEARPVEGFEAIQLQHRGSLSFHGGQSPILHRPFPKCIEQKNAYLASAQFERHAKLLRRIDQTIRHTSEPIHFLRCEDPASVTISVLGVGDAALPNPAEISSPADVGPLERFAN